MGVDIIARGLSAAETARRKRLQVLHALRASMARAALPDAGFGPNLVTNGTFDTDTAWTKGTGVTISGGLLSLAVSSGYAEQAIATVPGRTYVATAIANGNVFCGVWDGPAQQGAISLTPRTRSGPFQFHFVANDTLSFIGFAGNGSAASSIDHVAVREVLDSQVAIPSIGSNSASSTIATGTLWQVAAAGAPIHAEKYTFVGAEWRVAGATFPLNTVYQPVTTRAGDGTNPMADELGSGRVRFALDAPSLELYVRCDPLNTNGGFRLKVDGKYVRLGALGIDATVGAMRYIPITWGDGSDRHRKTRHYELEFIQNAGFGGVRTTNAYRPSPWPQPDGLRVLVHGDNMVTTVVDSASREGAATAGNGYILADLLGQADTWVSNVGGSGWFTPASPKTKNWFNDRVGIDVVPAAADVIVETGGLNDSSLGTLTQAAAQAAVESWLDTVLAARPDTLIFMTGPIAPTIPTAGDLKIAAAKAAAAAKYPRNVAYVDNLTDPWFFGTGRQGTVVGDGNRDWAIGSDTTHPTIEGHRYLAHRLAKGIAAAIPGLIARQG
ncbi:SGNH/GDSL hydrolase family protein [Novosphingobium sp.]|uniref:SGNH/GDSL hydrolase family protein n=1 Tax=Novosphingobium sp. TaxID=1874826 RepID=UPI0035AFC539